MKLIWPLRSRADLDRIWSFVAERDVDIAADTVSKIQGGAEILREYPRLGQPISRDLREWSLPAIRYVLTYHVEDGGVRIVRVHHARENRERP